MTVPLLSEVDVPCPDIHCYNGGRPKNGHWFPCERCEGRGTVTVLFFTCPTCGGTNVVYDGGSLDYGGAPYPPCSDPNHALHGPVTLARLSQVAPMWFTEKGRQIEAVFRKVAEWQAP